MLPNRSPRLTLTIHSTIFLEISIKTTNESSSQRPRTNLMGFVIVVGSGLAAGFKLVLLFSSAKAAAVEVRQIKIQE